MGFFSFTKDIAIDLGTANTIIICEDKIMVDEPSVVALDNKTDKVIAVGKKAQLMHQRTNPEIRTIRPLGDGVIADFYAAEQMIKGMIKMLNTRRSWFQPPLRIVICVPSGATQVERRAVRDSSERAGGKEVYLIDEPMAAAVGIDLKVEEPIGNMIVDIGGGTTEVAVISLGGIVTKTSIRTAGDAFTADIMEYMRRQHSLKVGEVTAEEIKINVGSVLTKLDNPPDDYDLEGANVLTSMPIKVSVSYQEIAHCLDKSIQKVEGAVMNTLENTPPELYTDIVKNGIHLTGGGALMRGLDKRLTEKINIKFKVAEDPLRAVARGTGIALKNLNRFNFLYRT
ncbi:MAG: rod shape-determining protein [Tannerella sp.]|nr:rod shape-determining protein [Tannerella sp.]